MEKLENKFIKSESVEDHKNLNEVTNDLVKGNNVNIFSDLNNKDKISKLRSELDKIDEVPNLFLAGKQTNEKVFSVNKPEKKSWWQKLAVVSGFVAGGIIAPLKAQGQEVNNLKNGNKIENLSQIKKYNPSYYTPDSSEYNPSKVYHDLSIVCHPELVTKEFLEADEVLVSGTTMTPKELSARQKKQQMFLDTFNTRSPLQKEIRKLEGKKPRIDPNKFKNKNDFIKTFVDEFFKYKTSPGAKEAVKLENAYMLGKASFYDSLLKKYGPENKDGFNNFMKDKPQEAIGIYDDFEITSPSVQSDIWDNLDSDSSEIVIDGFSPHSLYDNTIKQWQDEKKFSEGGARLDSIELKENLKKNAEADWENKDE